MKTKIYLFCIFRFFLKSLSDHLHFERIALVLNLFKKALLCLEAYIYIKRVSVESLSLC